MDKELSTTSGSNPHMVNDLLSKIENDEFDLEFRPITKGLGFSDDEDEGTEKKKEFIKQKALNRLKQKKPKVLKQESKLDQVKTQRNINRGDLQAFYENSNPSEFSLQSLLKDEKTTNKLPTKPIFKELDQGLSQMPTTQEVEKEETAKDEVVEEIAELASIPFRGFAFLVDFILVACTWTLTLLFFSFIANIKIMSLINTPLEKDLILLSAGLFLCYYFFYFTFMDSTKGSSIGKALVNINVRVNSGGRADVLRTFARSFVTLIGFLLMGIPWLIGAQDKVSGTSVFKANDY